MFKKLVQALSKIPGLGSLRRLIDDVDAPVANEKRGPEPRRVVASPPVADLSQPGSVQRTRPTATADRGTTRSAVPARAASPGKRLEAATAVQRLGLAAIGPGRAFAFWALSRQAIGRAREFLSESESRGGEPGTAVVLRVHDITQVDFDGSNARRTMDLSVEESAAPNDTETIKGNRYLDLWTDHPGRPSPARIYCELGVQNSAGDFVAVAWSPILDLPIVEVPPRELLVRALVNEDHSAHWSPRLEPLPSVSSSFAAAASATTSAARRGALATNVASSSESDSPIDSSGRRLVPVALDLLASAPWTFSSPSSGDLAGGRDRHLSPGGVSSGLLVRRRKRS